MIALAICSLEGLNITLLSFFKQRLELKWRRSRVACNCNLKKLGTQKPNSNVISVEEEAQIWFNEFGEAGEPLIRANWKLRIKPPQESGSKPVLRRKLIRGKPSDQGKESGS